MKIFALAATALFATFACATPAPLEIRDSGVTCTFTGAAASFKQFFPTDGSLQKITNSISVSQIQCPPGATCFFNGKDGSFTTVNGNTVSVGPPQTQVSGRCVPS